MESNPNSKVPDTAMLAMVLIAKAWDNPVALNISLEFDWLLTRVADQNTVGNRYNKINFVARIISRATSPGLRADAESGAYQIAHCTGQ